MSAADNGGWDFAVEVAANAISGVVGPLLPTQLPQATLVTPAFQGTVTPQASITGTSLTTAGDLTVSVSIDGTNLRVTNLTIPIPGVMNPPPDWLANIPIKGTVRVTDRLEMRPALNGGLASATLVIDFANTPVSNQPAFVAEIDDSFLSAPLVVIALAFAFNTGGQAAFEQTRDNLRQTIRTAVETAVRNVVVPLGVVTLVPPPALPFALTAFAFRATPLSLHVLYAMGPAGNTSLISRSMLLTGSLTGAPVDVAALSLGNVSLLRDFLRDLTLRGAPLGLPLSMFITGHPCLFVGPISITRRGSIVVPFLPGGLPAGFSDISLESLIAGIDESGLLHIVARLTATGVGGAFTVNATVDTSFRFAATVSGGTLTLSLTPITPAVVASDVSIAWWMYLAGALTGSLTLVGVLAAIDDFAGLLINGALGTAIGGLFPTISAPIPLPGRAAALTVRAVRSTQPDSATRSVTFLPGFTVSDPFRSHDLIVNLV
jgi:hypothetical protein